MGRERTLATNRSQVGSPIMGARAKELQQVSYDPNGTSGQEVSRAARSTRTETPKRTDPKGTTTAHPRREPIRAPATATGGTDLGTVQAPIHERARWVEQHLKPNRKDLNVKAQKHLTRSNELYPRAGLHHAARLTPLLFCEHRETSVNPLARATWGPTTLSEYLASSGRSCERTVHGRSA